MPILEISDLIVRHDVTSGTSLPVRRDEVVARLRAAGDRRGARIAARLPARDGVLDPAAVDRLLVRTHTELQRLNEELRLAEQLADLVIPLLAAVAEAGVRPRIVDIGCGIGYAVRWLAATKVLGDAELCGVDFNAALVAEASQLAAAENLPCRFVFGDAFALPATATAGGARRFPGGARLTRPPFVSHAVMVAVVLLAIAVVDAVLAGFRAATGRSGLIRKRAYYLLAMRRGLATGAVVLVFLAAVLGVVLATTAADPGARYAAFTRAGSGMLWFIGPFAAIVVASLVGYAMLPRQPATFLMLLGLGPMTIARPWITAAAGIAGAWTAADPPAAVCALLAAGAVLTVEPFVHRRWYRPATT